MKPAACNTTWLRLWRGQPPALPVLGVASLAGVLMLIPILYVFWGSLMSEQLLELLANSRLVALLKNTLLLTAAVTSLAGLLGLSFSWLAFRTDLPGRKFWRWALVVPLVVPPYVMAMTYQYGFPQHLDLVGFSGATLVLTLATYPYVYLIVSASIRRLSPGLEEAALSSGVSSFAVFRRVVLPLLRPALSAGCLLTAIYAMSDFGAVAMMRYNTFTLAVMNLKDEMLLEEASVMSLVLITMTIGLMIAERISRGRTRVTHQNARYQSPRIQKLGPWRWPSFLIVLLVWSAAVIYPVLILFKWTTQGILSDIRVFDTLEYVGNSLLLATATAGACMALAMPVVYLRSRHPVLYSRALQHIAMAGYALPGVIVALGLVVLALSHASILYNTVLIIVLAHMMRFLPQSLQAQSASLSLVPPNMEEAGRSMGCSQGEAMRRITLPAMLPGVLAGGALVFVSSLKELPATLMLRAPGFDTLAVRIYIEATEASFAIAAPAALLLISISLLPIKWVMKQG